MRPSSSINVYGMDESRFGLMTVPGRVLTGRGVKPVIPYQHRFENFYLFGAFSPFTGHSFLVELPTCNTEHFQLYLNACSKQLPDEFKILLVDNAAFHHSKALIIPSNMALVFLPPYCPELNPAERIWRHLKDALGNTVAKSLNELSDQLLLLIANTLNTTTILSLTAYQYITTAFYDNF